MMHSRLLLFTIGALLSMAQVYADTPSPEAVQIGGAQVVQQAACIREHEDDARTTPTISTFLQSAKQYLQQSAPIVDYVQLKQLKDKLDGLPHTQAVCAVQMLLKERLQTIKQAVLTPLEYKQGVIANQFDALQDVSHEATYASYPQVLELLDQVYTLAGNLKAIEASGFNQLFDADFQRVRIKTIDQEKKLLVYADGLFKKEYPAYVADTKKRVLPCLQVLENSSVTDREQQVGQKEKSVSLFLGHAGTNEQELLYKQLAGMRKQFLMSPCWQKFKIVQQVKRN